MLNPDAVAIPPAPDMHRPYKAVPIFMPGDRVAYLYAGPTRNMPEGFKLIRCAAEIDVDPSKVAFNVATGDFQPFTDAHMRYAVPRILEAMKNGERLYVGCMGGTGRTGTMLAILAAQHPDMTGATAIDYIRRIYKRGAVETEAQEAQVMRLDNIVRFAEASTPPEHGPADNRTPVNARSLLHRIKVWMGVTRG